MEALLTKKMNGVSVPESDKAIVSIEKVRDYLLSPVHPVGKFKAAFFYKIGYTQNDWEKFSQDIKKLLLNGEVQKTEITVYGVKYVISGKLNSPSGRAVPVVSIWMVKTGEKYPSLLTVYPGGKK